MLILLERSDYYYDTKKTIKAYRCDIDIIYIGYTTIGLFPRSRT